MNLLSLIVLCLFITSTIAKKKHGGAKKNNPKKSGAKKPEFPFPALDKDVVPYDSSTPFHIFDGIDYDELPKNFRDLHYTCQGEYVNCLRNSNYFHTVCMYAYWLGFGNYYSLCELEIRNCITRLNSYQGLYGTYYANDLAFYQGEGVDCWYSQHAKETRRLANLDVFLVPYRPFSVVYIPRSGRNSTIFHKYYETSPADKLI